jgi:hypothetical protein
MYADNTLSYCLDDGSLLCAPSQAERVRFSDASTYVNTSARQVHEVTTAPAPRRMRRYWLMVGLPILFITIALVAWIKWTNDLASISLHSESNASGRNASSIPQPNLIGNWTGQYDGKASTLIIESQNSNVFSGTLNSSGYLVAISGLVNYETGQVTLEETKVLKKSADKSYTWALGTNDGMISKDGRTMSGKGNVNGLYIWLFSKQ